MKNIKIILGLSIAVFAGVLIIVSCTKEKQIEQNTGAVSTSIVSDMLAPRLNDEQLVSAIQGLNPNYADHEDLFELLLGNLPLSAKVLEALAAETALENDFVEILFIVSSPVSESAIELLQAERPTLGLTGIAVAQTKPENFRNFIIINYPVKRIIFGERLFRTPVATDNCADCSSLIQNIIPPGILFGVDFGIDTGEPVFLKKKKCNPNKWVCGRVADVRAEGKGEVITCEGDEGRCIHKVVSY
jgi:hypothetical protein